MKTSADITPLINLVLTAIGSGFLFLSLHNINDLTLAPLLFVIGLAFMIQPIISISEWLCSYKNGFLLTEAEKQVLTQDWRE